jgi:hypothetical protein
MEFTFPQNPRELEVAEQLVLGATRLWMSRAESQASAVWAVEQYFAMFGVESAARSHAAILYNSSIAASRQIFVNGLCNPRLTLDESRIVHAIAHAQAGHSASAAGLLSSWLPRSALRLTMPPLVALAKVLAEKDLIVPIRPWSCAPDFSDFQHYDAAHPPTSALAH